MGKRVACCVMAVLAVAFLPSIEAAPSVALTATPSTGLSPLAVTLSWSSAGAVTCSKSGAWTGSAPLSGTQALTLNAGQFAFVLTCADADGNVTLSWTNPTKNTDGSTLTDLAAIRLFVATTSAGVDTAQAIVLQPPVSSYVLNGVAPGTLYAGAKATNAKGVDSVMSAKFGPFTVTASSASATANVTVNTQPNPPTALVVSNLVVELKHNSNGWWIARGVGTIPLNSGCYGPVLLDRATGGDYYEIDRDDATLTQQNAPVGGAKLAARCAPI